MYKLQMKDMKDKCDPQRYVINLRSWKRTWKNNSGLTTIRALTFAMTGPNALSSWANRANWRAAHCEFVTSAMMVKDMNVDIWNKSYVWTVDETYEW